MLRGYERELVGERSRERERELATGQQRGESAESWRGTTDRGGRQWTPEKRGEAASDRVQRRRLSQDVGIPVALWNFR